MPTASREEIDAIVQGNHADPFRILGLHPLGIEGRAAQVVRAFLPEAEQAWVVLNPEEIHSMTRAHPDGFFECLIEGKDLSGYRLRSADGQGATRDFRDPYAFPPTLSEYDLHLISEGHHLQLYEKLGAHPLQLNGVEGVAFALWAPNAMRVSVVGDRKSVV